MQPDFFAISLFFCTFVAKTTKKKGIIMQVNTMNPAQMMILESFAGARDTQELNDLMDMLRNFYAHRLEAEMLRLWENGTLDEEVLNQLRDEHLRTPYRK